MELTIEQKKKVLDFSSNFSEIAQREGWVSNYDTETDGMSVRLPKLSLDAEKKYINDEFAFYFNERDEIEGVFIEYFMTNFVAHHKDIENVKKELQKEIENNKQESAIVQLEAAETKKMIPELESVLINSFVSA